MATLIEELDARAEALGLIIDRDPVEYGDETWAGYWLLNPETGKGPLEDDNFSTSLEEVAGKLTTLELARCQ